MQIQEPAWQSAIPGNMLMQAVSAMIAKLDALSAPPATAAAAVIVQFAAPTSL